MRWGLIFPCAALLFSAGCQHKPQPVSPAEVTAAIRACGADPRVMPFRLANGTNLLITLKQSDNVPWDQFKCVLAWGGERRLKIGLINER